MVVDILIEVKCDLLHTNGQQSNMRPDLGEVRKFSNPSYPAGAQLPVSVYPQDQQEAHSCPEGL